MSAANQTIIGPNLPHIPWEERPSNNHHVVWRSSENPIILRDALPNSNSIFNSAVVPFKDGFAGVFRVDDITRLISLHRGFSQDGINWSLDENPIQFVPYDDETGQLSFEWGYDPRITQIGDRFYITWCNSFAGEPTIGLAYTDDFETFIQLDDCFLPPNRNGVLFPRQINGRYAMLSRPICRAEDAGDICYSQSPDLIYWGRHKSIFGETKFGFQRAKVGAGPTPIETTEGWLMIYHGVLTSCAGSLYSMGGALLDLDEPWKVLHRSKAFLLAPHAEYEMVGDVPNVVFPVATLSDAETGRIAIYYGAADTVVGLAYTQVDMLIDFIKANPL